MTSLLREACSKLFQTRHTKLNFFLAFDNSLLFQFVYIFFAVASFCWTLADTYHGSALSCRSIVELRKAYGLWKTANSFKGGKVFCSVDVASFDAFKRRWYCWTGTSQFFIRFCLATARCCQSVASTLDIIATLPDYRSIIWCIFFCSSWSNRSSRSIISSTIVLIPDVYLSHHSFML